MLSCCTKCLNVLPDIVVYVNCDTRFAINLRTFDLGENDEFIFAIKNYSYIESPAVFLFRARRKDIDDNGEIIFKIPPTASKLLKPGAFYNFALLANAFDPKKETEYKKLTGNGHIILEYGAHDLTINQDYNNATCEILGVSLELIDEISSVRPGNAISEITGVRLELLDEVTSVDPSKFKDEIIGMHLEFLA